MLRSDASSAGCLAAPIYAVNLKNAFRQIEPGRPNLPLGLLLLVDALIASTFWHLDAGSGSPPPRLLSNVLNGPVAGIRLF